MRLYQGTISEFKKDVIQNLVADKIKQAYEDYYKKKVNQSEFNSWNVSMNFLKNSVEDSGLSDNMIIIEYELPYSSRRIDVLVFGKNEKKNDSVVLIELKQWSNENVDDCETEGNVIVNYGRFRGEREHPALQVEGYYFDLKDFMTIFEDKPEVVLNACAYCHNYSKTVKMFYFSQNSVN